MTHAQASLVENTHIVWEEGARRMQNGGRKEWRCQLMRYVQAVKV
jgi:hypothetical protein